MTSFATVSEPKQILLPMNIWKKLISHQYKVSFEGDILKMEPVKSIPQNKVEPWLHISSKSFDFWDNDEDAVWDNI